MNAQQGPAGHKEVTPAPDEVLEASGLPQPEAAGIPADPS
jgi:hypothetical protein